MAATDGKIIDNEFKDEEDKVQTTDPIFKKIEFVCKSVAWSIIVISASFHLYRLFQYDISGQTCPSLFDSGHWIGNKWQPAGCMMHEYVPSEIRTCLQNEMVAMIGDSRTRALYFQLADSVSQEPIPTGKVHTNLKYKDKSNTSIEFYWIPELNDSVDQLLRKWVQSLSTMPHLIIMGVGTWTIKNGEKTAIVDYQEQLKTLSRTMMEISENLTRYKISSYNPTVSRFHREPQLIWIMQDPVVEEQLSESRKKIKNEKIEIFNYAAQKILSKSPYVHIMNATTLMAAGKPEETKDGLHYSTFILKNKIDAVLNAFCNDYIYPDDASCCKDLEKITPLQFNAFAVLGTCVILWAVMYVSRTLKEKGIRGLTDVEIENYESNSTLTWLYNDNIYLSMQAMAKFAAIMLYVFLADSSLLYNKDHKRYTHAAFFIPLFVVLVLGLSTRAKAKQTTVLNPDQINEWKGWMIIIIMLYNYTQAEQVLPIFGNVRLLVTSYLFMIGFVHFKQFWYSADFGLYKACKVLAHLNVFCVVLCLVMGHPYQFYVIIPLLSFWFVVVYLTMALFPRVTHDIATEKPKQNFFMVGKVSVLFVIIFIVWGNENICEWLFSRVAVRELFIDSNGEIQQWRFNSGLDRYSVIFGMLCSFVYVTLKRNKLLKDDNNSGLLIHSTKYSLIAFLCAAVCLIGFEIQAFTCHSKKLCDHTHSIASCVPILAFVILRNISGWLRSSYSVFFAWVGNMSLELFIGQYHIWLANDTHGIHVLIPGYPTINAIVTSFTFVCVIHEVKKISTILAEALVTKDIRIMLRRLFIFVIALCLIWWHKTHEKKPTLY